MTERRQVGRQNGIEGFPPISRADATTLILGSMPGRESLSQQRYYAHPRNGFWPIVRDLFEIVEDDYQQCSEKLTERGIAVWDVLKTCQRDGSLDSAIVDETIEANDFDAFFLEHPHICKIFFNGAKAESMYLKHVLPGLSEPAASLETIRLPSTSPAHAALSLEQKKAAWRCLLEQGED